MKLGETIRQIVGLPRLNITVEDGEGEIDHIPELTPKPVDTNLLVRAIGWLDRFTDPGMGPREGKTRGEHSSSDTSS